MTDKEKAKELVDKYTKVDVTVLGCGKDEGNPCVINDFICQKDAKQCALIAVDEIINSNPHSNPFNTEVYSTMSYWLHVKQQIELL